MITQSYLRYIFCNDQALHRYNEEHGTVSLDDIRRSLMLIERENNVFIPDHYYRLGLKSSFAGIESMGDLVTEGLCSLACEYLEMRSGIVYVKAECQNEWQLLLPYMPPLILVSAMLWDKVWTKDNDTKQFISSEILPNTHYTAIPHPYIPQMEQLRDDFQGMTDLHIHLNGALETDITWQDFLKYPDKVYKEMHQAINQEKVKEQYVTLTSFMMPDKFRSLLKVAIELRWQICNCVFAGSYDEEYRKATSFEDFLNIIGKCSKSKHDHKHPIESILGFNSSDIAMESFMYISVLEYIAQNKEDETLIGLFYYYMLILGLANRMLVQQPCCFGFEEFQKYTMNGFREFSEKEYLRRFFQMAGNKLENIRMLEGRFSPKTDVDKDGEIISRIVKGWEKLNKEQERKGRCKSALQLVAHFIKRPDVKPDANTRFKSMRSDLMKRAEALAQFLHGKNAYSKYLVGVDAAASEFDTPPEVFSQCYRYLRKHGISHFTYHAGEDYFHILSGLRAIYEAVNFLDLQRCDRIGHATAAGVDPDLWKSNLGDEILIRQGEYLDDLIFSFHMIYASNDTTLRPVLPILGLRIDEISSRVYQDSYPIASHITAWQMRKESPEEIIFKDDKSLVEEIFSKYHSREVYAAYDEVIKVKTYEIFDGAMLQHLQLLLLKFLHDKEIVIETLPTSNVVIGHHHDFSTYHLYNWIRWKEEGHPIPPIVLGTDDAGVFATNIYNEYCNLYCMLMYGKHMNSSDIVNIIKELDYNSRIYGFTVNGLG